MRYEPAAGRGPLSRRRCDHVHLVAPKLALFIMALWERFITLILLFDLDLSPRLHLLG